MEDVTKRRWEILYRLAPVIMEFADGNCVADIGMGYTVDWDLTSTQILAKFAEERDLPLFSCDIEPKFGPLFNQHIICEMDSLEFIKTWNPRMHPKIVFIDGWHMAERIRPEVRFFIDQIKPGAVIFCHDMYPAKMEYCHNKPIGTFKGARCGDAYKVRQDLERDRKELDIDIFTWPYTARDHGLTMIMKKDPNRPACRR